MTFGPATPRGSGSPRRRRFSGTRGDVATLIMGNAADEQVRVVVRAGPDDKGRYEVSLPSNGWLIVPGKMLFGEEVVGTEQTQRRFLAVGKGYYSEVTRKGIEGPAPGGPCDHCGNRIGRGMPRCKVVAQRNDGNGWVGVEKGTDRWGNGKGLFFCDRCEAAITFPEQTGELFDLPKGSS